MVVFNKGISIPPLCLRASVRVLITHRRQIRRTGAWIYRFFLSGDGQVFDFEAVIVVFPFVFGENRKRNLFHCQIFISACIGSKTKTEDKKRAAPTDSVTQIFQHWLGKELCRHINVIGFGPHTRGGTVQ